MQLKKVLESLEALPEEEKKWYVEKDGKFYLDVEGDEDAVAIKKKIDEFRNNNVRLLKEQEDLKDKLEKYKDLDPKKYREALEKIQKIDDKKLWDEGQIDELVARKTDRMRKDFEAQIKAGTDSQDKLHKDHNKLQSQFSKVVLDNEIQLQISKLTKPREGAMEDIVARGRRTFHLDDNGKAVARSPETGDALFSKDGSSPLTIAEWAENLPNEVPYFFEPSTGGGAQGGKGDESGKKGGLSGEALAKLPPTERLKVVHRQGMKKK